MTKPLTEQEVFDKVVSHLRAQGERSISKDKDCLYRGPGGLKCAAGVMIEDSEYSPRMEGIEIGAILRFKDLGPGSLKNRLSKSVNLLEEMQAIHDLFDVKDWEHDFQRVAQKFSLTLSPPSV